MTDFNANKTVKLTFSDGTPPVTLPVYEAQLGPDAINVTGLYKQSGKFTFDPGFMATASCRSALTYINGEAGQLLYCGYPIDELAYECSHLEVCELLFTGELPDAAEKADFEQQVLRRMQLTADQRVMLSAFSPSAHPMAMLVALVGAMSARWSKGADRLFEAELYDIALEALAAMPVLVAAVYRRGKGLPPVAPEAGSGDYAGTFLNMMSGGQGNGRHADPVLARALDRIFILHADHEQNASTSTVRLCLSSGTSPMAAAASGVACLWGAAHGGANEAALRMLTKLLAEGGEARIGEFIREVKENHDAAHRLIGFGHRVYKNYDPRARIMRETCYEVLDALGLHDDPLFALAMKLERIALEDDYFVRRKLYPNVDFYSGIVQKAIGIPENLFTAIFALARTAGWFAHMLEMVRQGLRLGRPRQLYVGKPLRHVAALAER